MFLPGKPLVQLQTQVSYVFHDDAIYFTNSADRINLTLRSSFILINLVLALEQANVRAQVRLIHHDQSYSVRRLFSDAQYVTIKSLLRNRLVDDCTGDCRICNVCELKPRLARDYRCVVRETPLNLLANHPVLTLRPPRLRVPCWNGF